MVASEAAARVGTAGKRGGSTPGSCSSGVCLTLKASHVHVHEIHGECKVKSRKLPLFRFYISIAQISTRETLTTFAARSIRRVYQLVDASLIPKYQNHAVGITIMSYKYFHNLGVDPID